MATPQRAPPPPPPAPSHTPKSSIKRREFDPAGPMVAPAKSPPPSSFLSPHGKLGASPVSAKGGRPVNSRTGVKAEAPDDAHTTPARVRLGAARDRLSLRDGAAPKYVSPTGQTDRSSILRPPASRPKPPRPLGPPPAHLLRNRGVVESSTGGAPRSREEQMGSPIIMPASDVCTAAPTIDEVHDDELVSATARMGVMASSDVDLLEEFQDWSQHWDDEVQAYYWYNTQTGEASWLRPTDLETNAEKQPDYSGLF